MHFWHLPHGTVQAAAGSQTKCTRLTETCHVGLLIDEPALQLTSSADQGSCTKVDHSQAVKAIIEGLLEDAVSAVSLSARQTFERQAVLPNQVC